MTGNQTAESEAQQEVNILCKEKKYLPFQRG